MESRIDRAVVLQGVLFDLLMAIMNSLDVWSAVAGDREHGLAWRDAVTARMQSSQVYVPYEALVEEAADEIDLSSGVASDLFDRWASMEPWPDADAVRRLELPYAFVTNCSTELATKAVERSSLEPAFTLSAEEAGCYKPRPEIYRLACERMGAAPEEIRFVAGAPYDALGANAAGLRCVLVARRPHREPLPRDIAVVASIGDALRV
jgi:2-haloacid dehalogenase